MNYRMHYDKLIIRAQNREISRYSEKHHIVPRCMGGTDRKVNIVKLYPEEHYVAHQLLVKIYPDNHKLIYAAQAMTISQKFKDHKVRNKLYGWLKTKLAKVVGERSKGNTYARGRKHSDQAKALMSKSRLGSKLSEETKIQVSKFHKGRKRSIETRARIAEVSRGNTNMLGKKHSEEVKARISAVMLGNTHALGCKASEETKAKLSASRTGTKLSEVTKARLREAWVRRKAKSI